MLTKSLISAQLKKFIKQRRHILLSVKTETCDSKPNARYISQMVLLCSERLTYNHKKLLNIQIDRFYIMNQNILVNYNTNKRKSNHRTIYSYKELVSSVNRHKILSFDLVLNYLKTDMTKKRPNEWYWPILKIGLCKTFLSFYSLTRMSVLVDMLGKVLLILVVDQNSVLWGIVSRYRNSFYN